jgi:hypothetical protein
MKKKPNSNVVRLEELKAMLAAYRLMTIDEVEAGGWGDLEIELEGEVWRLEQEIFDRPRVYHPAAA